MLSNSPVSPAMKRTLLSLVVFPLALLTGLNAEDTFHNFSNPPDDVDWPAQIVDGAQLSAGSWAGNLSLVNELNNTLFFDDNYLAMGSSSRISGNAMWANPESGEPLGNPDFILTFDGFFDDNGLVGATEVSFDFAWATTDFFADLSYLEVMVIDEFMQSETLQIPLDDEFFHSLGGNEVGREGRVTLQMSNGNNVYEIRFLNLAAASAPGEVGEFAIDNMNVRTSPPPLDEVYPVEYDGELLTNYGTNALITTGTFGFSDNIFNGKSSPAEFSVSFTSSSPFLYQPQPFSHVPIQPGETIYGAVAWQVNFATAPSGEYNGEWTVVNETNLDDPDNVVDFFRLRLFDQPALSDNTATPLTTGGSPQISNAAAGGHPGALRASVVVTSLQSTNTRFQVSGIAADGRLDPGQTFSGNVTFNAAGAPSGTHTGQFRMKMNMTSALDGYLNNAQPVADRVWNLSYTIPGSNSITAGVTNGQELAGAGLSISGPDSGAAIVGGTSAANQNVVINFNTPPQSNTSGLGSAVGVDFTAAPSLYVLQLSYVSLPTGYRAADLFVESYNPSGSTWVTAISRNSNGGATVEGAAPYSGSYAAYLAGPGGGTLDSTDLGAYGVDSSAKIVWVVVDYEGLFQLSTGNSVLPKILGITRNIGTNTTTITYQSIPGASHTVSGSATMDGFTPVGTTAPGTGAVMEFSHQPDGSPGKYFYRFSFP